MAKKIATIAADGFVDVSVLGTYFDTYDSDVEITFSKVDEDYPEDTWYAVTIDGGPPGYPQSSLEFHIDLSRLFQIIPNCVFDDLMKARMAGAPG